MNLPNAPPRWANKTFYGRLLNIFVVPLRAEPSVSLNDPQTLVLARVRECPLLENPVIPGSKCYIAQSHDALAPYVIDLETISAVVGRFEWEGHTYIIDRTDGSVDPVLPNFD